jgi:hypothetical protein
MKGGEGRGGTVWVLESFRVKPISDAILGDRISCSVGCEWKGNSGREKRETEGEFGKT